LKAIRLNVILLVLILSLSGILFASSDRSRSSQIIDLSNNKITSGPSNFFFQEETLKDIINRNVKNVDLNNDKLSDYSVFSEGVKEYILLFDEFNDIPFEYINSNFELVNQFESIPAIVVKSDIHSIDILQSLTGLKVIEENYKLKPHLFYSTSQMGVRSSFWFNGLTGSSDQSIAILDSGIDATHPAFDGRIVATYNAIDDKIDPIDTLGHGTHVASIAAGDLNVANDKFNQSARGYIDPAGGAYLDFQISLTQTSTIRYGIDWNNPGSDNPGSSLNPVILDSTFRVAHEINTDTTGQIVQEVTLSAGNYLFIIYNNIGAGNQLYEAWVEMPINNSFESSTDAFNSFAGMAFTSNIVAVKVLDANIDGSNAVGDISTIMAGIDWVIANRETHNITIVNMSLGLDSGISATLDTAIGTLAQNGILSVVAAGNSGGGIAFASPATAKEAITVGALNRFGEVAFYSQGGRSLSSGLIKPDVLAPGGSIVINHQQIGQTSYQSGLGLVVAADSNYAAINQSPDDVIGYMGTSMASPHIAGLASLISSIIQDVDGWDWNSASDVYRVKQIILASTYEVGNIGLGRERISGGNDANYVPRINRISKDNIEGWGAVNAKAAYSILMNSLNIGDSFTLEFDENDPFTSNNMAYTLNVQDLNPIGFIVDGSDQVDVDILIFEKNNPNNFGDLNLVASSTNPRGVDEAIVFSPQTTGEYIVNIRLVDGSSQLDSVDVFVVNSDQIPSLDITSPTNGQEINTRDVTVTFQTELTTITGLLQSRRDEVDLGVVTSGFEINDLNNGNYTLTLFGEDTSVGYIISDSIWFIIDYSSPVDEVSSFLKSNYHYVALSLIPVVIIVDKVRSRKKR